MASLSLRHTIATLAYRGGKAVRDAPAGFSEFRAGPTSRSAGQILAHVGDLLDWALSIAHGRQVWTERPPQAWEADVARFHAGLAALDAFVESHALDASMVDGLFQGPIADALTHVGQLAMLRRLAGSAVRAENYHRADIRAGVVGAVQSAPRREFD